jgi:pyridoxamine 5'-phosphate oxidase
MRPQTRSKLATYLFYIPGAFRIYKAFKGSGAIVADLRRDYRRGDLSEAAAAVDPLAQFQRWFDDALAARVLEPNAMTLATAGHTGEPSARTVLLKGFDARGFVFFTNYESRKGAELAANPRAALLFNWLALERQVEIRGRVERVSREETEAYFYSRPIGNQLGAWASEQSSVLPNRAALDQRIEELMVRYRGRTVPVPPHWGGYRVVPAQIEFWQGRPSRLHDRLRYTLQPDGSWKRERLSP